MNDGYSEEIVNLLLERGKLLIRIDEIGEELSSFPPVPSNWVDSLQSIDKRQFNLQDLSKLKKLSKELKKLCEEEQDKARKIRLYMIDNTLSELKKIEGIK